MSSRRPSRREKQTIRAKKGYWTAAPTPPGPKPKKPKKPKG